MWYSTTKLAKLENVTTQTIRRWIEQGKYEKVKSTRGGHKRVWVSFNPTTILYARVSSKKQESSITKQRELLKNKYPDAVFKFDVASGFNFKRREFVSLLERAMSGEAISLVATTSDRITRSGFPLIRYIIELHGGSIELLEENDNVENFNTTQLVAYITSFCNSFYGKRSGKRYKKDTVLSEE